MEIFNQQRMFVIVLLNINTAVNAQPHLYVYDLTV